MSGPSITYWNRIEPRPRGPSVDVSLAAEVRDPLWFLTRQWQLGEFTGQDAGSIAYVQYTPTVTPMLDWRAAEDQTPQKLSGFPVEPLGTTDSITVDLLTTVELGQAFEGLIIALNISKDAQDAVLTAFRVNYPINPANPGDATYDLESTFFANACAGRSLDGYALYLDQLASTVKIPAATDAGPITQAVLDLVKGALGEFKEFFDTEFSDMNLKKEAVDAAAWQAANLDYSFQVLAQSPTNSSLVLGIKPNWDGGVDWYNFDLKVGQSGSVHAESTTATQQTVVPTHVRIPGMPGPRFWDFESNRSDFGRMTLAEPDLGKMIFLDFILAHGHNWYIFPFDQDVGTLSWINNITVTDVFQKGVLVQRAESPNWTMFSTTPDKDAVDNSFFVVAPTASATRQSGAPLEEVRFFRDDMANMVWAVERSVTNALGKPFPGRERNRLQAANDTTPPSSQAPLYYRVQTEVPNHWTPFIPFKIDDHRFRLKRAKLIYDADQPMSRILNPTVKPKNYDLDEHEILRSGISVSRTFSRARWIDGKVYYWISRQKRLGGSLGASGLRFDLAEHDDIREHYPTS